MTSKNRWARTPNPEMKKSLKSAGPRKNYWVIGKDGVRRGPAPLDRDGVKVMEQRGAKCIPLAQGEFYTTEIRPET
jgi:hypothetical protein